MIAKGIGDDAAFNTASSMYKRSLKSLTNALHAYENKVGCPPLLSCSLSGSMYMCLCELSCFLFLDIHVCEYKCGVCYHILFVRATE